MTIIHKKRKNLNPNTIKNALYEEEMMKNCSNLLV